MILQANYLYDFFTDRNMMKLGMSKHWSEQMSMVTEGETNKMTGESFLKYFLPLYYYLEEQNRNNGDCVGWGGKYVLF